MFGNLARLLPPYTSHTHRVFQARHH
jgi:hypothetical protein